MISPRRRRSVILAATAAVTAVLAGPAPAPGAAQGCTNFTPAIIEAAAAPVAQLTSLAREDTPMTIFYEHKPSTPAAEEKIYINVQAYVSRNSTIRGRLSFDKDSDINMIVYNDKGEQVAAADGVNYLPLRVGPVDFQNGGRATVGKEELPPVKAKSCQGFTLESRAFITTGTAVKLELWIGGARR